MAKVTLADWERALTTERIVSRFWSRVDRSAVEACHPWMGARGRKGYGLFGPWHGVLMQAHRFALALKMGRPLAAAEVTRHSNNCTTTACCNQQHLRPGSTRDNNMDIIEAGRFFGGRTHKGSTNGRAILSDDAVVEIREAYAAGGVTHEALGTRYGVAAQTISGIVTGRKWRHLHGPVTTRGCRSMAVFSGTEGGLMSSKHFHATAGSASDGELTGGRPGASRITLQMTGRDIVIAMCDGNPGSLNVLMSLLLRGEAIDPDGVMGGLGLILLLDTFRIYGSRIWMLYKDVCREDLTATVAMLRACQLGMVSQADLSNAIDNRGAGVDVKALVEKVRTRLPRFGREEAPAPEARP